MRHSTYPKPRRDKRPAREWANDLLATGGGIMAVIFGLGPLFQVTNGWFVSYVTQFYGDGFATFASIFLFVLMAFVIFSAATLAMHVLASIFEGRAKLFGLPFTFK